MITIAIAGDRELLSKLDKMPISVRTALRVKVTTLALKLEARVKKDKLSGQVLRVRSGALRRSIFHKVRVLSQAVWGIVFSSGDVKYARIHEMGGVTRPHIIEPKKAQALRFLGSPVGPTGPMVPGVIFAKRVHHPGSRIPERSFLRSSLRDMSTEISMELKAAVVEGIRSA